MRETAAPSHKSFEPFPTRRAAPTGVRRPAATVAHAIGRPAVVEAVEGRLLFAAAPTATSAEVGAGRSPAAVSTPAALAPLTVTIDPAGPATRATPLAAFTVTFSRPVDGFDLSDLTVNRDGGPNLLYPPTHVVVAQPGNRYFVSNLAYFTAEAGSYAYGLSDSCAVVDRATGAVTRLSGVSRFDLVPAVDGWWADPPDLPIQLPPDSVTISFSRPIDGLDLSDLQAVYTEPHGSYTQTYDHLDALPLTLTRLDATDWRIDGLAATFNRVGTYEIGAAQGATVTEAAYGPSRFALAAYYEIVPELGAGLLVVDPNPRLLPIDRYSASFTEPVYGFDLWDLRLSRDGVELPWTYPDQTLTQESNRSYTLRGLTELTQPPGLYEMRLVADGSDIYSAYDDRPLARDAVQTWRVDAPGSVTFDRRPLADAVVRNESNAGTNFGDAPELQAGWSGLADGGRQSYLTFDVAGLASNLFTMHRAVLRLYGHSSDGRPLPVGAFVAPDGWAEAGVTWNNRPIPAAAADSQVTVTGTVDAWYELDVSYAVMKARAEGKTTLTVCVKNLVTSTTYATFAADETAAPPVLRVIQAAVPTQPKLVVTPTAVTVGEGRTATFTVRLDTAIYDHVGVQITRTAGDADVSITNRGATRPYALTLLFDRSNWSVPQTVSLAADQDPDAANGVARFLLELFGTTSLTVTATEVDDDKKVAPPPPPAATKTLRPIADAYVRDGTYANTKYGSTADLQVRRSSTAGQTRWAALTFDLASVVSFGSATLRLYGRLDSSANPSVQVQAFAASNATWAEAGVTWNGRPTPTGSALASATVSGTTGKWYAIDLTAWLKTQKAAGKTKASLVLTSPLNTTSVATFASDEAAANGVQLLLK